MMEIMKPAYKRPSQGSRWFFVEGMEKQRIKAVWPEIGSHSFVSNSDQWSYTRKRFGVIQQVRPKSHSYIVRPDCGSLVALSRDKCMCYFMSVYSYVN